MEVTQFHRTKYGRELLVDSGVISEEVNFKLNDNAFMVDFYELFFIKEGAGIFHLNEAQCSFDVGTILLLPPGAVRRWGQRSECVDAHYLIFEEEFIHRFFKDELFLYRLHYFNYGSPHFIHLSSEDYTEFQGLLTQLRSEIQSLRADSDHLLRSLLYFILIKINRLYEHEHQIQSKPYNNVLALKFRSALENHFKNTQLVDAYCDLLNVSRPTLNQEVKRAFAKSAGTMIRERIIREAKQQLIYTDKRISDIAYELSFSDLSNFNRLFKRLTTLTPSQFRVNFTN